MSWKWGVFVLGIDVFGDDKIILKLIVICDGYDFVIIFKIMELYILDEYFLWYKNKVVKNYVWDF